MPVLRRSRAVRATSRAPRSPPITQAGARWTRALLRAAKWENSSSMRTELSCNFKEVRKLAKQFSGTAELGGDDSK